MQKMPVWSLGGEDSLEKVNGNPLQYSCLEKSMDSGAWWATVHGTSKSRDWATKQQRQSGGFSLDEEPGSLCSRSEQFSAVQSRPILWDLMDCSSQASLSITSSHSLLKLMCTETVMPSNHFVICCPLLLLPSIFPSIRVFSSHQVAKVLAIHSFQWILSTTVQKHQFFGTQLPL